MARSLKAEQAYEKPGGGRSTTQIKIRVDDATLAAIDDKLVNDESRAGWVQALVLRALRRNAPPKVARKRSGPAPKSASPTSRKRASAP